MVRIIKIYSLLLSIIIFTACTTFNKAIEKNNFPKVKQLIDEGKDVNAGNIPPLIKASKWGRLKIVNLLIKNGADVNKQSKKGLTALINASSAGHLEIVNLLIKNGADVNKQNKKGYHALMAVSDRSENDWKNAFITNASRMAITTLLIKNGANANIKDNKARTPLHVAAANYRYGVAEILLKNGADTQVKDDNGWTPLMHSANTKKTFTGKDDIDSRTYTYRIDSDEMVKILVKNKAEINAINKKGETALMIASRNSLNNAVEALLKNGADSYMKNKRGKTALSIAKTELLKIKTESAFSFGLLYKNTKVKAKKVIDFLKKAMEK